ncbi:MAG TPA: TlpA disulfide reductase family protein [Thermoanaerobaculia bacterium]|nr:TlpA disulfide reductase family protein [Thermoanaerobaculia bacterium]
MKKRCWLLVAGCLWVVVLGACKREEKPVAHGSGFGKSAQPAQTTSTAPAQTASTAPAEEELGPGSVMPAYASKNLDGSAFDLAAHRDKVVLLNVWATWCGPCRFEIPELQRIHDTYAARGFEVVGVSVDESEAKEVRAFVDEQKVKYPIVHDVEQKLPALLNVSVLPTSVLVGRDGKIVWKKVGAILEGDQELKSAIEKAL